MGRGQGQGDREDCLRRLTLSLSRSSVLAGRGTSPYQRALERAWGWWPRISDPLPEQATDRTLKMMRVDAIQQTDRVKPDEDLVRVLRQVWVECRFLDKPTLPPEVMDDGVVYLQLRRSPPRSPVQIQTWMQEMGRAIRTVLVAFPHADVRACPLGLSIENYSLQDPPF